MLNKLVCLALVGTAPIVFGQDTTQNKQNELVNRFETITGKEVNYKDSLLIIKKELSATKQTVAQQQSTIVKMESEIVQLQKYYLIGKYGQAGRWAAYGEAQKADFDKNAFLTEYNKAYAGVHVYFAFEETKTNLANYSSELNKVVSDWKANPTKKIVISGYSDSWGKENTNLKYSKERAECVTNYLISVMNVPSSAIKMQYFGSGGPKRYLDKELDFLNRQTHLTIE